MKKYTIDATGKSVGRLATEVASILNGKTSISFVKNKVAEVEVDVVNASKMKVTGDKMNQSIHKRFSGYPGGLKELTWERIANTKGFAEILRHAVRGMLPKNKLQELRMKNLNVNE